jgi:peptidyl-prolyl cis-trans isomerase NIMA-interacting 1
MPQLSRTQSWSAALALTLAITVTGCADLTVPGNGAPPAAAEPEPAAAAPEAAPPAPTPAPPPEEAKVAASHVLIQYKGSMRSAPTVTRSKEEAKKLAGEVLAKAKKGQDFAGLAKQYSDEPGAKDRAGALGKFGKGQMVKPFSDAAFALKPGEISAVVETDFGFHVIKRTE